MALEIPDDQPTVRELVQQHGYEWVGARVRSARLKSKRSIRDIASAAGVSKNTLVRLERGEAVHNSSLEQILWGLKLTPRRLMSFGSKDSVLAVDRADDAHWYDMRTFVNYSVSERIKADVMKSIGPDSPIQPFHHMRHIRERSGFQPFFIRLVHATEKRHHRGEELIYILSGRVTVEVGETEVELGPHDAMLFNATEPHAYIPISKDVPEIFCMIFSSAKEDIPHE